MLNKDALEKQQKQKQKDTHSVIDVSGISVSEIQNEKSRSRQQKQEKKRKHFNDDLDQEDSYDFSQEDYSIQGGRGTKPVKGKKQEVTELKDMTSLVSDEVIFKSQVERGTDKVEMGSPRFVQPNRSKQTNKFSQEESSKRDIDEENLPIFDPVKIRVQQKQKTNKDNSMRKQAIYIQEESELQEKSSLKSFMTGSSRRRNRGEKVENFFDFSEKLQAKQEEIVKEEEGMDNQEVQRVASCVIDNTKKATKKRKKKAKLIRENVLFYTSKSFYMFHITEVLIFWLIIALFPEINVIDCISGHHWMTHLTFGMYLMLTFIFDWIFTWQYVEKESLKQELQSFNGQEYRPKKKCWGFLVGGEAFLQLIITQFSLLQLYCVVIFITIVRVEDLKQYLVVSLLSLMGLMLFKVYAFVLIILIFFNCLIKSEDKKRKFTYRALLFQEFRLQALNVEYLEYNKRKTEFVFGLIKLLFFDIWQFATMVHYLRQTNCGLKNANVIIYVGVIMHVFSAYFGFLSRFVTAFYHCRRAGKYKEKVNLKISTRDLQYFGFRTLRDKMSVNKKVESLVIEGETYEYLALDEPKTKSLVLTYNILPQKFKIEFFSMNRVKIEQIRQAKSLFSNLKENFQNIKFVTIQQCHLCPNFILQLNRFLAEQQSLLRFSLIMNKLSEDEILMSLETCIDHPNLEVLQVVEKIDFDKDEDDDRKLGDKSSNRIKIMKSIQVRIERNESLRKLEIRYYSMTRQMIQILLKGLIRNNTLQKLILTNNALKNAGVSEFHQLEQTLKTNTSLIIVDFSENDNLNNNQNYQEMIVQGLFKSSVSSIKRLYVTSEILEIKEMYLQFMEDCQQYQVYMNGKLLEDVDIQEMKGFKPQIRDQDDSDEIRRQIEESEEY